MCAESRPVQTARQTIVQNLCNRAELVVTMCTSYLLLSALITPFYLSGEMVERWHVGVSVCLEVFPSEASVSVFFYKGLRARKKKNNRITDASL